MALSVRLDDETKQLLNRAARAQRVSRSEIVRRAIHAFVKDDQANDEPSLYDRIKDLIGSARGLPSDGSARVSEYFYDYLVEKKGKGRL